MLGGSTIRSRFPAGGPEAAAWPLLPRAGTGQRAWLRSDAVAPAPVGPGSNREENGVDPQKLLKTLEGAVFELALWVLLLPKTLFRVLRQPVWVFDYTTAEMAKPESERFDDYL